MKEFKLNGISIDFRFLFIKIISRILEENKKSSKFKEGTNEEQTSYIFKPDKNLNEEIEEAIEILKKSYSFDYEIKGKDLFVKDIKSL
jgi:antirestriction protein